MELNIFLVFKGHFISFFSYIVMFLPSFLLKFEIFPQILRSSLDINHISLLSLMYATNTFLQYIILTWLIVFIFAVQTFLSFLSF